MADAKVVYVESAPAMSAAGGSLVFVEDPSVVKAADGSPERKVQQAAWRDLVAVMTSVELDFLPSAVRVYGKDLGTQDAVVGHFEINGDSRKAAIRELRRWIEGKLRGRAQLANIAARMRDSQDAADEG